MSEHLTYIKKVTQKPVKKIKKDLAKARSSESHDSKKPHIESIRVKEVDLNGEKKQIKRVYVKASDSHSFAPVGWVANDDIKSCMVCYTHFGFFTWRHHCRACGNLICFTCSERESLVVGVESLGPLKVCIDCCTVQAAKIAMPIPVYSTDKWGMPIEMSSFNLPVDKNNTGSSVVTDFTATSSQDPNQAPGGKSDPIAIGAQQGDEDDELRSERLISTNTTTTDIFENTSVAGSLPSTINGGSTSRSQTPSNTTGHQSLSKSLSRSLSISPIHLHGAASHEEDCREITREMMDIQFQNIVTNAVSAEFKRLSVEDPKVLIGWQIATQATTINPEIIHKELYIVTEIRKNLKRKTEFKLCCLRRGDNFSPFSFWTLLRRNEKKHGLEFVPLQQVLHINEELNREIAEKFNAKEEIAQEEENEDIATQQRDTMGEQSGCHSMLDRASLLSYHPDFDNFEFPDLSEEQRTTFVDRRHTHNFNVRGPQYNTNNKKVYGGSAMCKLMLTEVYEVDTSKTGSKDANDKRHDHIVSRGLAKQRLETIAKLSGNPFQFVINFQIPGDPPLSIVQYFAIPPDLFTTPEDGLADLGHFQQLMNTFVNIPRNEKDRKKAWGVESNEDAAPSAAPRGTSFSMRMPSDITWPTASEPGALPRNDFRNCRFKLVPTITEGPWVVKQAVGSKPTLLGKKVVLRYFRGGDDEIVGNAPSKKSKAKKDKKDAVKPRYLEIDVHIGSSGIASQIVGVCRGAAKHFIADIAYIIEAETEKELPEKLLGVAALSKLDLSIRQKLD